jgi:hypothetical protein
VFFDSTQVRGWNRSDAVAQFGRFFISFFSLQAWDAGWELSFDHSFPFLLLLRLFRVAWLDDHQEDEAFIGRRGLQEYEVVFSFATGDNRIQVLFDLYRHFTSVLFKPRYVFEIARMKASLSVLFTD